MGFQRLSGHALLLLAVLLMGGCTAPRVSVPPPPPPGPAEPEAVIVPSPEPSALVTPAMAIEIVRYATEEEKQVAERLDFYQEEWKNWQELAVRLDSQLIERRRPAEWNECLEQLETLVARYRGVRDRLRDLQMGEFSQWPATTSSLSSAYRVDLEYSRSNCGEVYQLAQKTVAIGLESFQVVAAEQLQTEVLHHARAGRVEETMRALENLNRAYPEKALSSFLLHQVSIALARAGAVNEALDLLARHETVTFEPGGSFDPARLQADLLLIFEQENEALKQYEKAAARHAAWAEDRQWVAEQLRLLRGEVTADSVERGLFIDVLRDYILFDGRTVSPQLKDQLGRLERLYPAGSLTARARQMTRELEQQAERWLDRQRARIENLLAAREYDEAISRLDGLLAEDLTSQQRGLLRQLLATALSAREEAVARQQQLEGQSLSIQWEEANRLLGLGRREEAIQLFSRLQDSEYGDEARRLMREAGAEAAAEIRREAAGLFLRARRSEDSARGRELAVESWRQLRRIIEYYPDSDIVPRVRENLQSVEGYLESLEPGLVERLKSLDQ